MKLKSTATKELTAAQLERDLAFLLENYRVRPQSGVMTYRLAVELKKKGVVDVPLDELIVGEPVAFFWDEAQERYKYRTLIAEEDAA